MWPNPQFPADLVTFTGGNFNGKYDFWCSALIDFLKLWKSLMLLSSMFEYSQCQRFWYCLMFVILAHSCQNLKNSLSSSMFFFSICCLLHVYRQHQNGLVSLRTEMKLWHCIVKNEIKSHHLLNMNLNKIMLLKKSK